MTVSVSHSDVLTLKRPVNHGPAATWAAAAVVDAMRYVEASGPALNSIAGTLSSRLSGDLLSFQHCRGAAHTLDRPCLESQCVVLGERRTVSVDTAAGFKG